MLIPQMNGSDSAAAVLAGVAASRLPGAGPQLAEASDSEQQALQALQNLPHDIPFRQRPFLPHGSIAAWSMRQRRMRIAIPSQFAIANGLGRPNLGATHAEVQVVGLGDGEVPAGATPTTEDAIDAATGQTPLWKTWEFWAAIGAGVIVLGGIALLASSSEGYNRRERNAHALERGDLRYLGLDGYDDISEAA